MKFKTGLRLSPEPPIFRFGDYLHKGQLPSIPTTFGHYPLIQPHSWGMLANDKIGDCLAEETLVLTSDLQWIPIGQLNIGDKLVGFDEFPIKPSRYFKTSIVERIEPLMKPCYDLILEDGTKFRASFDHQWLRPRKTKRPWIQTEAMRVHGDRSTHLCKFFQPWQTENSYLAGYLAGALDGEGCYATVKGTAKAVQFAQRNNEMLSTVATELLDRGYNFKRRLHNSSSLSPKGYELLRIGNRQQVAKLLGTIRPKRLLPKFIPEHLGRADSCSKVKLIEKKFVGRKPVLAVQTSTRTFIAEGFASHNCTIAGPMHAVMLWNMIAGRHIMFTPLDAIDDYRDCCGYVPGDDSTDQGGDMVQVAKYWQKTGMRDNHNRRHKIIAYMHVDATRLDYLDAACYLFGAVGLGIRVGDTEEYAFEHDQPWIMPGTPVGGHYVPYVGKDLTYRKVVTWGGLQNVGEEWLKANLDEVVAYVSEESLINGKSFEGFDIQNLEDDLQALA